MSLFDNLDLQRIPTPLYTFDVTYRLMNAFINNTEEAVALSVSTYKATGPQIDRIEISPEEGIYEQIEHYQGLDEHAGDIILDDVFESYFPSLQRRSALLTLIATYEHELEMFCDFYAQKHQTPVKLNDMKGKGLERVHLFVKKLIGLEQSGSFAEIKKLIKLRNSCAHNDARLTTNDGQLVREIKYLIDEPLIKVSQSGQRVHLHEGFLAYVLEKLNDYVIEIKTEIERST